MKVNWLLQTDVFDENLDELKKEIKNQGHKYTIVDYKPFSDNKEQLDLKFEGPVLFYGSINFGQQILRGTNWTPGVYCDSCKYDCSYYYLHLHDYLLNNDFSLLPFGFLEKNKFYYRHIYDDLVFVRPNSGTKSFTGQVVDVSERNFVNKLKAFGVKDEELILVSTPLHIKKEWRLIVTDKVITGSQYKDKFKHVESPELPERVVKFANNLLLKTKFRPEPIWTLDICESGDKLYVLEIGCFSCAGFYMSDVSKIVKEASTQAILTWKDIYE